MATFYREQVSTLHTALLDDSEATRLKAGEVLRTVVKEILLTPEARDLRIDVRGDLAGIWRFPSVAAGVNPHFFAGTLRRADASRHLGWPSVRDQ
jgi:hypothetical protein